MTSLEDYYKLINESTYIKNLNSGETIVDRPLSGLAFNTGPLYNKQQDKTLSSPSMFYADNTKIQSNMMNIKNLNNKE
jgi:hypothetical protein